jgi:hypothetical protein
MKSVFVIIGAVAVGYVAHKFVGRHVDQAVSKVHDRLKEMVKKGAAAKVAVGAAEA